MQAAVEPDHASVKQETTKFDADQIKVDASGTPISVLREHTVRPATATQPLACSWLSPTREQEWTSYRDSIAASWATLLATKATQDEVSWEDYLTRLQAIHSVNGGVHRVALRTSGVDIALPHIDVASGRTRRETLTRCVLQSEAYLAQLDGIVLSTLTATSITDTPQQAAMAPPARPVISASGPMERHEQTAVRRGPVTGSFAVGSTSKGRGSALKR